MTQDKYIDSRDIPATISVDPYFPTVKTLRQTRLSEKGGMWGDPPSDLQAARREPVSLDYQMGMLAFVW